MFQIRVIKDSVKPVLLMLIVIVPRATAFVTRTGQERIVLSMWDAVGRHALYQWLLRDVMVLLNWTVRSVVNMRIEAITDIVFEMRIGVMLNKLILTIATRSTLVLNTPASVILYALTGARVHIRRSAMAV